MESQQSQSLQDHIEFLETNKEFTFDKDEIQIPKYKSPFVLFLTEPVNPYFMRELKSKDNKKKFIGVLLEKKPEKPTTGLLK